MDIKLQHDPVAPTPDPPGQPRVDPDLPKNIVELVVYLAKRGISLDGDLTKVLDNVNLSYEKTLRHRNAVIDELRKKVESNTNLDPVTGLPMRDACERELSRVVQEEHRGAGYALLFVDHHRFKFYNDEFKEHAVGDLVLRTSADLLKVSLRQNDFVARWGGDEMVGVLLDLRSVDEAIKAAARFVVAVRNHNWIMEDARIEKLLPTVDVGVIYCEIPPSSERHNLRENTQQVVDELVRRADFQMYMAKDKHYAGKVGVCIEAVRFVKGEMVNIQLPGDVAFTAV